MSTSKEQNYSQALPIGGGMYPVGPFPLVVDKDVAIGETDERLADYIPIIMTQVEYNNLEEYGETDVLLKDGTIIHIFYDENKVYLIKYGPIDPGSTT